MVPPETGGSTEPIVVFDKGRVAEEGPPSQIFTNPESPRTKAFLKVVLQH